MLTPGRSLALHADSGRELPKIPELTKLYNGLGVKFRHGQVVMIAGRSGSQKSGFALWLAAQWNLSTLYFSADMSPFTASSRLACMATGDTTEQVEAGMREPLHKERYLAALEHLDFTFSFGSPITWRAVDEELASYVETRDCYPEVIVLDNLMDFEGAESDYTAQMQVMSEVTEMARETGATIVILHHASDKSWAAQTDPWSPPSRQEIKGGLSEKPELSLSVALDPTSLIFNVACIKQRMGPSDPTGRTYIPLRCKPEQTRFEAWQPPPFGGSS